MDFNNNSEKRLNFVPSKDKILIDAKKQSKSQAANMRNVSSSPDNQLTYGNQGNKNYYLMNKKERERFEELGNANLNNNLNPLFLSQANNQMLRRGKQYGKVVLDPLGSSGVNKYDLPPPIGGNKRFVGLAQIKESVNDYDRDMF